MPSSVQLFTMLAVAIHSWLWLYLPVRFTAQRFNFIARYIVVIFNALVIPQLLPIVGVSSTFFYLILIAIITLELLLIFRCTALVNIAISFGILLHFFACRSITLGVASLISGLSMSDILMTPSELAFNNLIVFIVHDIVLIFFISLIPPTAIKEIIANKTLLNTISLFMVVLGCYFVFNAQIFHVKGDTLPLSLQQVVLPLLLLGAFYFLLLFMVRLVMLDAYKATIEELEKTIDKNQMLSNTLFNQSSIVVEFNATKSELTRIIIDSQEISVKQARSSMEAFNSKLISIIHPDDMHLFSAITPQAIGETLKDGKAEISVDYRAYPIKVDAEQNSIAVVEEVYLWHRMQVHIHRDETTQDIITVSTINNINEEKELEISLRLKSELDPLTGSYNKDAIKALVSEHVENGGHGTLFVFDVDNFKGINDNFGHAYGDVVLCEINANIKSLFRSNDLIGRFGGDEFVAFIHGDTEIDTVKSIANRICKTVNKSYFDGGLSVSISASVGVAICPKDGSTYEQLFVAADTALYDAKRNGKNTFIIYNELI